MCGRYTITANMADDKLRAIMSSMERHYPHQFRTGEIRPGDSAPALIGSAGKVMTVPATFGFTGFQDDKLLINARVETVSAKPTFAESFEQRRIILPASGFFEWAADAAHTKYLFTPESKLAMYLCGIWRIDHNRMRFVILTRPADATVSPVHNRMPLMVGEDDVRSYLTDTAAARSLVAAAAVEENPCQPLVVTANAQ